MNIREQALKLTSIFSKKSAEKNIRNYIRSSPRKAVEEALNTLRELANYKPAAAKKLHQILVEEAVNPEIAGALAEKALKKDREAIRVLEEAGYPVKELVQLTQKAAASIPMLPENMRDWLERKITETLRETRVGRLNQALSILKQAVSIVEETITAKEKINTIKPPVNSELAQTYRKLVEEAWNTLKHSNPRQAARKLKEIAEKLEKLKETDKELTTIKQKLEATITIEPELRETAEKTLKQAVEKATSSPDPETLKQVKQKAETLYTLAHKINTIRREIGDKQANQIIEKTKQNPQQALKLAETTTQYKQLIKQTGITPQQLEEYLEHIAKNYPKQITNKTREILKKPPKNTQTLIQEIKNKKPPYKTHQQTKTTTPKQTIKQTIKQATMTQPKKLWKEYPGGSVESVSWSPGGDKLAVRLSLGVVVYSSSGKLLWDSGDLGGYVWSVSWSPSGEKLAVGIGWEEKIGDEVYDHGRVVVYSSMGKLLWDSGDLGGYVWSVSWSPSGEKLAVGGRFKKVIVYSSTGQRLWEKDLGGWVWSVSWSPDGTKITVRLYNRVFVYSSSGKLLWDSGDLGGEIYSVSWSPDGGKLAVGGDFKKVVVYSSTGQRLWESEDLGDWVRSVSWSPDGGKLAVGGDFKKVVVYSSTGKLLWDSEDLGGEIYSVSWSPDGGKLAVGTVYPSEKVVVYSSTGQRLWEKDLGGSVKSVSWSPSGEKLAVGIGWRERVIVFGFGGLGGLCEVVGGVLVSGAGVSGLMGGGSGVCGVLAGWVLGRCGGVSSVGGVVGDALEFLCGGDVVGVLGVLGFAVDAGYWDDGLFEVARALTLGWGWRLFVFDSIVSEIGGAVGASVLSVFDWLVDLLGSGRPVLTVAEEVRGVVGWVLENAGRLRGAVGDERFVGFVRGARYDGLKEFVGVLREGLSFLESPDKCFRLRVGFEGSFRAGVFSEGKARICNGSVTQVVVSSMSFKGVEGSVLSGLPLILGPGECGEVEVSLRAPAPGRVPVEVSLSGEVAGVSTSSIVETVVDVSPQLVSSVSPSTRGEVEAVKASVPSVPASPYLGPHFLVGRVLSLRFSPPRLKPIPVKGVVIGGFELRAVIGFGGFAVTLLGVDEVGRSFAVKLPREAYESIVHGVTYAPSKRGLTVFEREFKVLKGLSHPHLARLVGGGVDLGGVPYLVMEFCGNGSLRGVLEFGSLSLEDALLIGVQVADVLAYLHSKGIIHRDLKPENILFTGEGLLKVTDFNIAKVMGAVTTTTSRIAYTPGYAAPEQIMWGLGKTGPWTDIWSLGIILYETITGEPPFEPWEYEDSIKEGVDLSPLPEELKPIIKAMLTVEPEKRPPATEVRNKLAEILIKNNEK